ncbi:MAG: hypothetical protein KA138_05595 [Saprospiraceae bacterium]|nr:hypothetical protein [Saprospiraceae bacterium]
MEYFEEKKALISLWSKSSQSLIANGFVKFENPDASEIESLILFYSLTNEIIKNEIPELSQSFQEDLLPFIYKRVQENRVMNKFDNLPLGLYGYINYMTSLYLEELDKRKKDEKYWMPFLLHTLVFEPLTEIYSIEDTFVNKIDVFHVDIKLFMLPPALLGFTNIYESSVKNILQKIVLNERRLKNAKKMRDLLRRNSSSSELLE